MPIAKPKQGCSMSEQREIELFSTVRLKNDRPEEGLKAGEIGTVVDLFEYPCRAYEVEFVDDQGRTIAQFALLPDEIDLIHYLPTNSLN